MTAKKRAAFILAPGPHLNEVDLSLIKDQIVICVNEAILIKEKLDASNDIYWGSGDIYWSRPFQNKHAELISTLDSDKIFTLGHNFNMDYKTRLTRTDQISFDMIRSRDMLPWGYGSMNDIAFPLCLHLGVDIIFLVGVNHSNHETRLPHVLKWIEISFKLYKSFFDDNDIQVFNTCASSEEQTFDKLSYEECLVQYSDKTSKNAQGRPDRCPFLKSDDRVQDYYLAETLRGSDINQHLPTLLRLSNECESVVEFGTRYVVSAWAFLNSSAKKITLVDITKPDNIDEIKLLVPEKDLTFIEDSDLNIEIDQTDLLFIDTWHCYDQLKAELDLHAEKVNKYIVMHDVESFGEVAEGIYGNCEGGGLKRAIDEFLEENKMWKIKEWYTNNNGLAVLERRL